MRSIIGTIIKLKDFFCKDVVALPNNGSLCANRTYFIPYYQREIRWEEKNIDNLIADIKANNEKFLGNIILSQQDAANANYEIIDGQQRITSILMIIHYLTSMPSGALNFSPVGFKINSFSGYKTLVEANFDESRITPATKKNAYIASDDYSQRGRYVGNYAEIKRIFEGYSAIEKSNFISNLLNAQLNIIVSIGDHDAGMEYFLDVNLKAVKLETEDIFKGYFFKIMGQVNRIAEAKEKWEDLKKAYNHLSVDVNYSLVTLIHHYILCTINSQLDYAHVGVDPELNIYDKRDEKSKDITIGSKVFHKGDNILSTFGAYDYPLSVVVGLKEYIEKILKKAIEGSYDTGFKSLFVCTAGSVNDITKQLIFECIQAILKGSYTIPKALIMKYGIEVLSRTITRADDYKKLYSAYFLGVVFSVLENKTKEMLKIESILREGISIWCKTATSKGKDYFDKAEFGGKKAYKKYMIRHAEEEDERYLACSLALIYNYFKIENDLISVKEGDALKFAKTNKADFTIEHFLVNSNNVRLGTVTVDSKYPSGIKKIKNSLFNFIFAPEAINRDDLKNFDIAKKINIITSKLGQIKCAYSKKVLEIMQSDEVAFGFPDWSEISDKDIAQERVNNYFSDSEETDDEKFFLPAYERYAEAVLDAVKDKFITP